MGSIDSNSGSWRKLNVGVVGGGIGGFSVAISLRRAGHDVVVYEKADYAGEVGASVSCAANGTRWLHEWNVDTKKGDPVVLKKLINRDWRTGEPISVYDLSDYEQRWGYVYNMFHRQQMHTMLKDTALQKEGAGKPAELLVNHAAVKVDVETGSITFSNGKTVQHDLVIGADGIGSVVRGFIGISPNRQPSGSSCLHANVSTEQAIKLGLVDYSEDAALEYWGGQEDKWDKIVLSPCNGGDTNKAALLSYYCFFPREEGDYMNHSWGGADRPVEELLKPYPTLDRQVFEHLKISTEIRPWRIWEHEQYPYIVKGRVALLGDAGHPMMPHQSQGACMAIEDAAAFGILFSQKYFRGDISEALDVYNTIRLPRTARVQIAASRAAKNMNERIGLSENTNTKTYRVANEKEKLTIEEMNYYDMYKDIEQRLAEHRDEPFNEPWLNGLPKGLRLPSGILGA
ncbi:hypothetical protein H2204_004849 [Knufia peltigerae]|uniref:FAD-binding domain-containing protein n=1 Tax=Knufia peltigerae TaxID=1002370 RepID=A0AA38Y7Z7_9EURO|nr:hypothetical protein H2204_004849 [Knufia peltigerae]